MISKKILAVIPARGGSKGLSQKNVLDLCGKPLISWTINASLESNCISKTIVTSDDANILKVAAKYGAETILRPKHLATDSAIITPVITHVLESLGNTIDEFDYIALLQPTSPLRTSLHIEQAFKIMLEAKADSVISVSPLGSSVLKTFVLDNGYLKGAVNNSYPFMSRQDLPDAFQANGAIYIIDIGAFLAQETLLTNKTVPFEMDNVCSIDIDNQEDFDRVKGIINKDNKVEDY